MDLSKLDTTKRSNAGMEVKIVTPDTGQDTGIRISMLGRDSDLYRKTLHEQNRKRAQRTRNVRNYIITSEEIERDAIDLLAHCATGWTGIEENGAAVSFSVDAARDLFTRFPTIREQVDAEVHDRANFTGS